MESTQTMELFNTLFYVSLTIAILGLIAAVSLFFLFDIPTVFALMTGRAKKKTIERMISQSGKGESLRKERAATVLANAETSGNLNRSSKLKRGNPAPAPMPAPAPAPAPAPTQMPTPAQNADDGETVMLSGQTANQSWQQPAAAPQPVPPVPPQQTPQPVQPAAPQPQPVQPTPPQPRPQPVQPTPPQPRPQPVQPAAPQPAAPTIPILEDDEGGCTAPLKGNPAVIPGRRFVITEDTMVIHTNDVV